jgi:hypothetical protein
MMVDNALANLGVHWILRSGDTGKGRVEHRSFLKWVNSPNHKKWVRA